MPLTRAKTPDDYPGLLSIESFDCAAGTTGQNVTIFRRIRPRATPLAVTTTKVYNGGTVAGNYAVSVWVSNDGGVTVTRLGGTASTAQSGANAAQIAALAAGFTVPAGLPLWISHSTDSATATYLRGSGFAGTFLVGNRLGYAGSYNATADQTLSALTSTTLVPWIEVS